MPAPSSAGTPARPDRRGTRTERGYSNRWARARETYLTEHPLCVRCHRLGRVTAATVVDHVRPHRQDWTLFWDSDNWQALCAPCHSSAKQAEERGGQRIGCDENGLPHVRR